MFIGLVFAAQAEAATFSNLDIVPGGLRGAADVLEAAKKNKAFQNALEINGINPQELTEDDIQQTVALKWTQTFRRSRRGSNDVVPSGAKGSWITPGEIVLVVKGRVLIKRSCGNPQVSQVLPPQTPSPTAVIPTLPPAVTPTPLPTVTPSPPPMTPSPTPEPSPTPVPFERGNNGIGQEKCNNEHNCTPDGQPPGLADKPGLDNDRTGRNPATGDAGIPTDNNQSRGGNRGETPGRGHGQRR